MSELMSELDPSVTSSGEVTDVQDSPGAKIVETHISLLFFVAGRVYKLHKPVRFGFLDFTERTAREHDCHREVALNRRLAPDVYLGVADVTIEGVPIDHMVVMRALPEERRLAALVRGGRDIAEWLDRIAATLASFHATAERSDQVSAAGSPDARRSEWESNFAEARRFVGPLLDEADEGEIEATVFEWLSRHAGVLEDRAASGQVCDGHGDLQAEDVFCLDDGVRILDCVEFSDSLRHGDVCADVAFLAMDLERLGRLDAAHEFVRRYEAHSGRALPRSLLHQYIALRAYVRAKVECLRYEQGDPDSAERARVLHGLALRHLRQARHVLVLVGGLPGSGKSTLARALGAMTGWTVLRSDVLRHEVVGDGPWRYAPEAVDAVYAALTQRARLYLQAGEAVIVDASWVDATHRTAAMQAAADAGSELAELWCRCRDDVAAERIRSRRSAGADVSEATIDVRAALSRRVEVWETASVIDTSDLTPEETLAVAAGSLGMTPHIRGN
jgi:aminoglycoside phosphotransferase family enzyme/predicted kinase